MGATEVEVGQLVVEQETAPGDDDAAAAPVLDGEGVGDDVAVAVGHREVGGVRRLLRQRARRRAQRHRAVAVEGVGVARRDFARCGPRPDLACALAGVGLRQQTVLGHIDEFRIGEVGVAVGEGQARGFEVEVLDLGARPAGEIEALEQVERLGDRDPSARGGGHAVDLVAAVGRADRLADARFVVLEVGHRHAAGERFDARTGRRVPDRGDDAGCDRPFVESLHATVGEGAVGPRQIGVAVYAAGRQRLAVLQVERGGSGKACEFGLVGGVDAMEIGADGEPFLGDPDRRRQHLRQAHRAVARQRLVPAAHGAGHPYREAAGHRGLPRHLTAVGVHEHARMGARRGRLAVVDGDHALVPGDINQHEPATADAAAEGLGDAERGCRGDCGIDRIAAAVEDLDRGPAGFVGNGGDGAAAAGGERFSCPCSEGDEQGGNSEIGAKFHCPVTLFRWGRREPLTVQDNRVEPYPIVDKPARSRQDESAPQMPAGCFKHRKYPTGVQAVSDRQLQTSTT